MTAQGDRVRYQGRDYTILTVTDLHYGLVDDTRPPMVDDQNGQQVAHMAVRHDDVEPITADPQWRLRDVDNRGVDGEPHEITGTPDQLIDYLDGPVRRDLIGAQGAHLLNQLIDAYRRADIDTARTLGPKLSIYTEVMTGQ